jgi:hypothetical protein
MRPIRHDKETAVKPPPTVMRQAFHAWLLEKRRRVLPKLPLGETVDYALSNRATLIPTVSRGIWRLALTWPSKRCGK